MRDRLPKLRGRTAPLLLIAVGGAVLLGCIPLPGRFSNAAGDRRPEAKIGPAGSDALVRIGRDGVERAVRVFGDPDLATADGRVLAFGYEVVTGYFLWPLCFSADRVTAKRWLALRFDARGRLAEAEVFADLEDLGDWAGADVRPATRPIDLRGIAP